MTELFAIGLVLALLGLLMSVVRVKRPSSTHLRVLATTSLGGKHSISVVQAGSLRFLVGFSGSEVSKIADLDPKEWPDNQDCSYEHMISWRLFKAFNKSP